MVKPDLRPTSSAWRRRILTPMEWNVPSHGMPSTAPPTRLPMRSFISRAALLVKVTERTWPGKARPRAKDVGDARRQHACFAGAGAGENQHRPVERFDGRPLLGIEAVEIGRRGHRGRALQRARRNGPPWRLGCGGGQVERRIIGRSHRRRLGQRRCGRQIKRWLVRVVRWGRVRQMFSALRHAFRTISPGLAEQRLQGLHPHQIWGGIWGVAPWYSAACAG